MKTTIDIPDGLVEKAQEYGQANNKRETVIAALEEYIQKRQMASLASLKGTMKTVISQAELQQLRD